VHVVQITDFYRPVLGGLERHVETLSGELIRLGHTVTVVTLQTGGDPAEETLDGVRVVRIRGWSGAVTALHADTARPFHPTAPDPGAVAALRQVLQRERPSVVHSHSWLQYSYFPLHRARRGPAHVVALHDYGMACAKKTLQRGTAPCSGPRLSKCLSCAAAQYGTVKGAAITTGLRASRFLHGRADRYIANSAAVADAARAVLPGGSEIVIVPAMVPNGLPAIARSEPRPGFLPPDDGYLMFVGALGPHKGVHVLLEAWRRMRNRPALVLIGTPRADTPRADDPAVVLAHNVPPAQVMAAWQRASIAVVPSVWSEPMGLVAVEAMLAGRPVVASDVGGLRDLVRPGVTGLTVPPGDPPALTAALDSLLDDPEARRRMGEAGRLHARRFEAAALAPRVLEVFEDALQQRVQPRSG
jgi:glycosyltransferase involved in cell wall biosynthesis